LINWFSQTLTTLKLEKNEIGAHGAQYIANELQQNKVTLLSLIFLLLNYRSIFFTDTHKTWPWLEQNRCSRSTVSGQCNPTKWSNFSLYPLASIKSLIDFFSQTLETLNLTGNEIGARGVRHLADALRQNKVT